ncbi:MAG: hypothetical protein RRB13_05285 [bacterium]|nr:hypothetical protein [bacterium]
MSLPPDELKQSKIKAQEMARNSLKKMERATIRLTRADFEGIKIMAAKEGMGYQTLISSLIHKYLTGQIEPN